MTQDDLHRMMAEEARRQGMRLTEVTLYPADEYDLHDPETGLGWCAGGETSLEDIVAIAVREGFPLHVYTD